MKLVSLVSLIVISLCSCQTRRESEGAAPSAAASSILPPLPPPPPVSSSTSLLGSSKPPAQNAASPKDFWYFEALSADGKRVLIRRLMDDKSLLHLRVVEVDSGATLEEAE